MGRIQVVTVRCAVRAAYQRRNVRLDSHDRLAMVPTAGTRSGPSQRDRPYPGRDGALRRPRRVPAAQRKARFNTIGSRWFRPLVRGRGRRSATSTTEQIEVETKRPALGKRRVRNCSLALLGSRLHYAKAIGGRREHLSK